jgi:hypothetical protein
VATATRDDNTIAVNRTLFFAGLGLLVAGTGLVIAGLLLSNVGVSTYGVGASSAAGSSEGAIPSWVGVGADIAAIAAFWFSVADRRKGPARRRRDDDD